MMGFESGQVQSRAMRIRKLTVDIGFLSVGIHLYIQFVWQPSLKLEARD